jgi:hypothetical protein
LTSPLRMHHWLLLIGLLLIPDLGWGDAPEVSPLSDEEFERAFQATEALPDCPPQEVLEAERLERMKQRQGKPYTHQEMLDAMRLREDPEWLKANPPCADSAVKEQRRQIRKERMEQRKKD